MIEDIIDQFGRGFLMKPVPTAKVIEVFGSKTSVGKTTLALYRTMLVQRGGGTVLYIDADNTLNYDYVKNLGVDTGRLLVSLENDAGRVFSLIEEYTRENKIDLIIVDTITALIFKNRFGEDFTRLVGLISKSNVNVMLLHQIRWNYEDRSNIRSLVQIFIDKDKIYRNFDGRLMGYGNRVFVKKNNILLQKYLFNVKKVDNKFYITTQDY